MTVQDEVRAFILESFYLPDPEDLAADTSLIDSGIVDSTGMLEVILFLERTYEIQVLDTETTPENLETLSRIAAYVADKQARGDA